MLAGCVSPPRAYRIEAPRPLSAIDDSGLDALLRAHVRGGGVDYSGFCGSPELRAFLLDVANADPTRATSRAERLAFLINAYNALAIAGILDGSSPETLWGRHRFFQRARHPVAGERITLWDLEHARIRPLGEPRIHFALVCASASCPRLASRAWRPATLEAELEAATRAFVNDPTRNRFDAGARTAHLSRIFDWYTEDFVRDGESVATYVARYVADPELARDLLAGDWRVEFLPYDWSLNGTPPHSAGPACAMPATP